MNAPASRSQHGEDLELIKHFRGARSGYFVEVGALDGVTFSNTYLLEKAFGWRGILVEADPSQAGRCRSARSGSITVQAAATSPANDGKVLTFQVVRGFEAMSSLRVTPHAYEVLGRIPSVQIQETSVIGKTLDRIFEEADCPTGFDVLSIDIEGHEPEALDGLSLGTRWKPSVVLIENSLPYPRRSVTRRLNMAGYGYVRTIGGINDWYETRPAYLIWIGEVRHYLVYLPRTVRAVSRRVLICLGLLNTVIEARDMLRRRRK